MRQWTVDAFASDPFRGNPACVVEPFDQWPDDGWMQALAMENNQAETAFLLKTDRPNRYGLRWFTPAKEAPLCGHATLGAAHVLFEELGSDAERLGFDTLSGQLVVTRAGKGYEMDFPADMPVQIDPPEGVAEAVGCEPVEVWAPRQYLTALLPSEAAVRAIIPNADAITRASTGGDYETGSLLVAGFADPGKPYDVVVRFFAPGFGINEDPATGSAHCILGPLFAAKLGRDRVSFFQAYPGRGAEIETVADGERVLLRGQGFTTIESVLRV